MSEQNVPNVTLNNGVKMPQLGLGVWQAEDGKEVESAVLDALSAGYRLIDTAAAYGNEKGVGKALRESGVSRDELFITTKLWNNDQGYESTLRAFDASMSRLGLDYLDLYLIHWPMPSKDLYVDTWRAFEKLYNDGKIKAIGVSNFEPEHLERLAAETDIVPAVNQIELHPLHSQLLGRKYADDHGIFIESWSPIGGKGGNLLEHATLDDLARKYAKTPAQIVIRWHLQSGLIVIPKSVRKRRIEENIDVFDFSISEEDMTRIDGINTDSRIGPDPKAASF